MFIKTTDHLIPVNSVIDVDISMIEHGEVTITTKKTSYKAYGFDAIEAVMLLKPSALEGKSFRWQKNAWAFHNFFGHPIVQILSWMGLKKQAVQFHDWTTPTPRDFKIV